MIYALTLCLKMAALGLGYGCSEPNVEHGDQVVAYNSPAGEARIFKCATAKCLALKTQAENKGWVVVDMPKHKAFFMLPPETPEALRGEYVYFAAREDLLP
jgi:hypothetical protein